MSLLDLISLKLLTFIITELLVCGGKDAWINKQSNQIVKAG